MPQAGTAGPALAAVMETQHAIDDVSLLQVSKMFEDDEGQIRDKEPPHKELLMRRDTAHLANLANEDDQRVQPADGGRLPKVSDLDQEPTESMAGLGVKSSPELPASEASAQGVVGELSDSSVQAVDTAHFSGVSDLDLQRTESVLGLGDKSAVELLASQASDQLSEHHVQQNDDGRLPDVSDQDPERTESMAVLGVRDSPELPEAEASAQSGVEHLSEEISLAEQIPEGDVVGLLQTSVVVHRRAGRRGGHGGRNAAKSVKP